ncbi:AAA family ATPase [Methylobacterium gnaphalii]|uniref:AAA+ ATPase domain-containing protein n=1 Tax=Methylobacterium gnaphalii TaxID=1010610 RepID=A0A512JPZ0_9HYPH|nr:AAA family ATPase [Methylobacterium gnaphalii]GEP12018.1 hypothetical protein MGN01_38630 [Methylobacterium gnaphalii]GJD71598.1 hypothetical protein MMMDOFMJ_4561 [Methylobacterium gnaphalii]GLS51229.1 hypothetical protein GCM10007885_40840 [Methylobacterium gnaphalii]
MADDGSNQIGTAPAGSETSTQAASASSSGVAFTEAALRARYGTPICGDKPSGKAVGFQLPDGRQIGLQRDVGTITIWIEADGLQSPLPIGDMTTYTADQGRHSNLPPRLKHDPGASLRAQGFPRAVASVKLAEAAAVAQLLDWYDAHRPVLNRAVLERLKQVFLAAFPDFLPSAFQAEGGKFHADEDTDKRALIARVSALVDGATGDDAALGSAILEVLLGRDHNLLGNFRTNELLRAVRESHPGVLEAATGRLARDTAGPDEAAAHFVETVWPALSAGREANMPYAESRVLPTLVLALVRPDEAILVRYQPFYNAGMMLLGRSLFANGPLTRTEYATVLELSRAIFAIMRDAWDWRPRDLFDVQSFIWVTCRDRAAALSSASIPESAVSALTPEPTNLILYGPPGTGKTFRTAAEAVRLCGYDDFDFDDRSAVMAKYRELCGLKQIAFVTFHQSYSYEEFIEGLRPKPIHSETGEAGAGFTLEPEPGAFVRLARSALTGGGQSDANYDLANKKFFKMSIGRANNSTDEHIFEDAIETNSVLLGWGDQVDWSDEAFASREAMIEAWRPHHPDHEEAHANVGYVRFPYILRNEVRTGDIIIVSRGNSLFRAIGEVVGPYRYVPREADGYVNQRPVRWLWVNREGAPVSDIFDRAFAMAAIYELAASSINRPVLERYILSNRESADAHPPVPFVLIIDEINRANISKVFGELITLIEPDKRFGGLNALEVQLPYSRSSFVVPANLHIIGTMNTADRSIALLDTALRRRFTFRELMPDPSRLPEFVDGVPLRNMLRVLNERIEYLFDRDHQIGHAYFIGRDTRAEIDVVMRTKVIPLLVEYFFEDWTRVAIVLGDADAKSGEGRFLVRTELKPPPGMTSDDHALPRVRWALRDPFLPDAYASFA